jgi:PAS domain S-box-containing protein
VGEPTNSILKTFPVFRPSVQPSDRSSLARLSFAAGIVLAGLLGRMAITPVVGPTALPFIFFFPAVVAAAWYGGWWVAVISVVLSALTAKWFFIEPVNDFFVRDVTDLATLTAFVFACAFIILAIETMHRATARMTIEMANREAADAERAQTQHLLAATLASIGDGVIVTNAAGRVTFMNAEAERLTCWKSGAATGQRLDTVFRILNEKTRQPVQSPVEKVLQLGSTVGLANHTLLVARDGTEVPIDDSAAPIRTGDGPISGVVLVFRDVREQRKAENERAHLAAIVEFSGDAIITKDLNAIVQSWNAGAERLFGYRPEEIIGKSITLLIPPDRLNEESEILSRLHQGLPFERIETVRLHKEGRQIHVSLSVSPLKDKDNNVIGASKIVHDISDIVAAREALASERELLATTLSSIGDAVIVTDAASRVTFLNPEAERLTGWTRTEAEGVPLPKVFQILNEETRQTMESPVEKVLRIGGVVGLANHAVLVAKNGTETPIDDSAAPIIHTSGETVGVVLVFRDFTTRRQAEQKLRESEERFRSMADAAPVLIWVAGPDKLCTWFNQGWLNFVGRSMDQELGTGWTESVHPDDLDSCIETYNSAFDNRIAFSMTYRMKRHDGEYRWVLDSGIPRHEPGGRFMGYIGCSIDITERQQAEEALHEASRRKDEFLAILSHELRNPLSPIRTAVTLLNSKGSPDPEMQHLRDTIDRQTKQLTRLLDDLMDVSRITSGKITLVKEPLDLRSAISSAVESVGPQMDTRKHQLKVNTPPEPVFVDGDLARLAQVFANLLSNAAKYSEEGKTITVTLEQSDAEAIFRVADEGIGISPDQISRIFEMFAQVDQSLERGQGGLGVGLSLAKKLVQLHGGQIEAKSEGLGKGSEFIVRLPTLIVEQEKREEEPPEAIRTTQARRRVLVADDNVDSAAMLTAVLHSAGHEVRTTYDGLTTLEAVAAFRPDVAILDIGMPRLNGYEVARRIRTYLDPQVVLIAVTGWGQQEDKQLAIEAGFNHHLTKPVDIEALYDLFNQLA